MRKPPSQHRLSDSILLSDILGCDSAYRYGYSNRFDAFNSEKWGQAYHVAGTLEELQEELGPFSISYGYISPELSQKIVTYQDPNKPSYHRFELGAALDVCFHDQIEHNPPIFTAHLIDDLVEYSRLITYSESEFLCFATNCNEKKPRKAFYENRFEGKRQPKHIKYPEKSRKKAKNDQKAAFLAQNIDWRGQGWPSYHGKGLKQFHHMRLGKYCCVSDFLYDDRKLYSGERNLPPFTKPKEMKNWLKSAEMAAKVYDLAVGTVGKRISVIRAFNSSKSDMDWQQRFTLELELGHSDTASKVASILEGLDIIRKIRDNGSRLLITGENI